MCVCVCVCLCVCLWQRFLRNYWADYNQTSPVVMKCALVMRFVISWRHHFWWRHTRKNWVSHAYREIRSKYYWIFMKISEYLYFSTGLCCIVFGENRNSLNIQNGGPKFSKFAYLSEISQFCSDFKTKYIFVINMIIWFQNYIFLCVWDSISSLKNLLPV